MYATYHLKTEELNADVIQTLREIPAWKTGLILPVQ